MTLTDLYRKALEELRVVAAGESADPDDTTLVRDKYTAVYDMLLTLGLVAWGADEDVPDYAVQPLTRMVAFAAASAFNKNQADYADGAISMSPPMLAEQQLRRQLAKRYVSHTAQSEYY
jgi:hypothetical protein